MPDSQHIILYATKPSPGGQFRSLSIEGNNQDVKYHLAVETMNTEKVMELSRKNREIAATAPSIPLQLIKPFEILDTDDTVNDGQIAWGVFAVNAPASVYTGKGVKVAVLDTGIDRTHDSFNGMQILEEDFTGDGNGDVNGHGTHCAGTIFGRDTNGIRIGIAKGIQQVYIGKVIGKRGGDSGKIVNAIRWALDQGAHIISMSLGIDFPGYVRELEENGMKTAPATSIALEGYRKNILLFEKVAALIRTSSMGGFSQPALLIAAAGNESQRPNFEIAVSPPAVSDGIISVGALGKKDNSIFIADFSNTGPVLSAPGVNIQSAKIGGGLSIKSGTSMATPHVAGVAALWAEKMMSRRQFTINQLAANLTAYCSEEGLDQENPVGYGAGMVQAPK